MHLFRLKVNHNRHFLGGFRITHGSISYANNINKSLSKFDIDMFEEIVILLSKACNKKQLQGKP